jgi:DNA-directed RNA polymerase specialized sigma subunit
MKKKASQEVTNKTTWNNHHAAIKEAFVKLYQEKKHAPTQEEIAKQCNLSRKCVNEHMKEIQLDDVTPAIKSETLEVLNGLTKKAKTGDPQAVKLWMQLVHGWKEKTEHSGYIGTFDPSKCSMDQIERIANGEDPGIVLQNTIK